VRFDPLVVDLLLDAVDREAQLDAPFAGTAAADDHAGLRRADRDLQMLYGLGRDLSLPLDLGQRLTLAATRLASAVPFDGLAVAVEGAADGPPAIRFAHGPAGARLRRRLAGRSRGDARVGHDGRTGPEVPLPEGKTLALPLVDGELRPGTLWLYREQGPPFDARERALLVSVAGRLAGTLSRAAGAAREPRRDRSLTDPTTGLPNGRYLRLHCAHRLAADDARFGLVALQLRGLQEVGERRGAAAVDRLLAHAARRLAEAVRKRDLAARFGPDQFVVLTDEHEAGALVTAWTRLAAIVEEGVASIAGGVQVRVAGAHAVYPETGPGIEELLAELGRRLPEPRRERSVVPFRATASAS
jgi:diguanylate cyclase (GGDEF)-like protein